MNKAKLLRAVFGGETSYEPGDEVIAEVLGELTVQERFVLEHRFADQTITLEAISQIYPRADGGIGVIRERVRQIEARALRRLRQPGISRRLWADSEHCPGGLPCDD